MKDGFAMLNEEEVTPFFNLHLENIIQTRLEGDILLGMRLA